MNQYKGKCACGEIAYQFDGDPLNTVFCYCQSCQLMTSSDKYFGAWVPHAKFRFINGNPDTYTRQGESGKPVIGYFCGRCHTFVCAHITAANMYSVAVSSIDSDHSLRANMAIHTRHAKEWAILPSDIPCFDSLPPNIRSLVAQSK